MSKKEKLKKRILITGASGMLGTTFYEIYKELFDIVSTDIAPLDPWTQKLDVRDKKSLSSLVDKIRPDRILNFAALTDVEYCETHPDEAYDTNAQGAENVAEVCKEYDIPMVHISTAGVFDGKKNTPYMEQDLPNPVNIYGKAKNQGDIAVQRLLKDNFHIFRAGWMMGGFDRDKKFVKKILEQIDQGKTNLYGLTDMFGCPTYTKDFSQGIVKMLEVAKPGLYHMVSEGNCSRFDVAKKIIDFFDFDKVTLTKVTGDFFEKDYYAPRPPFEVIVNEKIHNMGIKVMRNWEDALKSYLSEILKRRNAK
ncbi:dTDP-4-dehydrorhamnose reductase [candidate division WWE3 bacterium CG08_land_8_20_14_0_20_40_13]|uniref:dTDP-4-dehydrorhamnose reductase n=1 Tax=candidate division WWE3 bacterium CG08_land_8_20_14_0_20_40_13 TaxID=1975084 RepID=A0A2H0XEG6_UNCKA|nr:MAG: dTDP-4-dehydrorhamnose reductase [candidate division WWE3 bacterium CG08_land_8_20_14_0_20_40_13]